MLTLFFGGVIISFAAPYQSDGNTRPNRYLTEEEKMFKQEVDGVFHVSFSADIGEAIENAIKLSEKEGRTITFAFNEVLISAEANSDPSLLYRDYHRAINHCIDRRIGPHPNPELSEEEKLSDRKVMLENRISFLRQRISAYQRELNAALQDFGELNRRGFKT